VKGGRENEGVGTEDGGNDEYDLGFINHRKQGQSHLNTHHNVLFFSTFNLANGGFLASHKS